MTKNAVDASRKNHRAIGSYPRRLVALAAVVLLAQGCAHRGRPPECKGPYTPINPSLVASSDGTQR